MPAFVMTASPRTLSEQSLNSTPFRGSPSKRSRKRLDHVTANPQFAGRSGDIATPLAASTLAHAPSEPSRGQLAPPSANTVARPVLAVRSLKSQIALVAPAGP